MSINIYIYYIHEIELTLMKLIFDDPTFSLQLLRAISETYYKGADIGECLSTAYRIKESNFESWYNEWFKTAKRVHNYAQKCLNNRHNVSAREAFLRSSNYYRVAGFLIIDPQDVRSIKAWKLSKDCFNQAARLFPSSFEPIQIPYEQTSLPGYFFKVNDDSMKNKSQSQKQRPILVVHGGFDSTLEELYFSAAAPALERGYNCLAFEGPGQGEIILKQKIPFRFDWEKVVTPVIDYLLNNKEKYDVDTERIALMGISMGGYLAARAAAFEDRLSACILYNGVYDGKEALESSFPPPLLKAINDGNENVVNKVIETLMETDSNIKFNITHGMRTFGIDSPYELIKKSSEFSLKEIAQNIRCPTVVLDAEKDDSFPGQPQKVYNALVCPKKYILFTAEEGAEEHCQCGAPSLSNQRIFDWLDEMFQNL
jgi:pimeloyl-ACP methyl ester carboxylesterase